MLLLGRRLYLKALVTGGGFRVRHRGSIKWVGRSRLRQVLNKIRYEPSLNSAGEGGVWLWYIVVRAYECGGRAARGQAGRRRGIARCTVR